MKMLLTTSLLDWYSCGDDARCAVFKVPADWNDPAARRSTCRWPAGRPPIKHTRSAPWSSGRAVPWDSGVYRVTKGYERFSETVRSRFDIVSFDPRGSLGGHPIPCDTDQAGPKPPIVLTRRADFDATMAYNRRLRGTEPTTIRNAAPTGCS